jgi:hypothetical protein
MTTFRITSLAGGFGNTCPPPIVFTLFPSFDGWAVTLTESFCEVTVPNGITPVDLGPLVKVEIVTNE